MKLFYSLAFLILANQILGQDDKFLPSGGDFEIIKHTHYIIGYSEDHEQSAWVAYELTPLELAGNVDRTDDFREDRKVTTLSAGLIDYKGSGYDRGHLAPAADFSFDRLAMSESFYMSNMSPQHPSFNRGAWSSLEKQVRAWVGLHGSMYVITGPVLNNPLGHIGINQVSVPNSFFKIIYSATNGQVLGVVMPNEKTSSYHSHLITIDEIEVLTGLNFLEELPDDIEDIIEASLPDLNFWKSTPGDKKIIETISEGYPTSNQNQSSRVVEKMITSVRCEGFAVSAGRQCKNMTRNANKHCHVHQSQVGKSKGYNPSTSTPSVSNRCTATTKAGTRCKRSAAAGSTKCWQH